MNLQLFRSFGWIYRPVSLIGWLATLLALAFCAHIFWVVDSRSHSVSDTLYGVFPYVVPCLILWNWFASNTCADAN
jgi:hypothetical protein